MVAEDDLLHLVMQCPAILDEIDSTFKDKRSVEGEFGRLLLDNTVDVFPVLLLKYAEHFSFEQMGDLWLKPFVDIHNMYL